MDAVKIAIYDMLAMPADASASACAAHAREILCINTFTDHFAIFTQPDVAPARLELARALLRACPPSPREILDCARDCMDDSIIERITPRAARFMRFVCALCLYAVYGEQMATQPMDVRNMIIHQVIILGKLYGAHDDLLKSEWTQCYLGGASIDCASAYHGAQVASVSNDEVTDNAELLDDFPIYQDRMGHGMTTLEDVVNKLLGY